ncbi:MAG: hypothetical protein E1N59_2474 [Puniceicoccaceae bacterium 5H]|nr:MAG: hypothetical protein E1N59_2474 [Puniceicoccaceae bacterium 5H]
MDGPTKARAWPSLRKLGQALALSRVKLEASFWS